MHIAGEHHDALAPHQAADFGELGEELAAALALLFVRVVDGLAEVADEQLGHADTLSVHDPPDALCLFFGLVRVLHHLLRHVGRERTPAAGSDIRQVEPEFLEEVARFFQADVPKRKGCSGYSDHG